jgi:hypothetical protein
VRLSVPEAATGWVAGSVAATLAAAGAEDPPTGLGVADAGAAVGVGDGVAVRDVVGVGVAVAVGCWAALGADRTTSEQE